MKYPFDPATLDAMPEELAQLFRELELTLLQEISRRLMAADQLTEVTVQAIRALRSHGISVEEIKKAIRKATGISEKKLDSLLEDVIERNQRYYSDLADIARITMPENIVSKKDIEAIVRQTQEELTNITRTMGFVVDSGRTAITPTQAYKWALDKAEMAVQSGVISYNQAIANATKELADSGVTVISYDSGHRDQVDVAVRRAVMTGVNQLNSRYAEDSMDYLETEYVEVSAHAGARDKDGPLGWENHKKWQGKVYWWKERSKGAPEYQYPDFEKACGYGSVTGILGANCRHNYTPFIPDVMERTYTDEELANIDPPDFVYEGKKYTHYEATQKQREIERAVRHWKRREAAATTPEDKQAAQIRQRILKQKYEEFSKAAHLRTQPERMKAYVPRATSVETKKLVKEAAKEAAKESAPIITNTPKHPDTPVYGGHDATAEWMGKATPNSHRVTRVMEFEQDGVLYKVDGGNVKMDPSAEEIAAAKLLRETLGGDIRIMPKVSGDYRHINTPDFLFRGARLDHKQLSGTSLKIIENRIHKAKGQADNFMFDVSNCPLSMEEIFKQSEAVYYNKHLDYVNVIMIVKNGKIVRIYQRNK